MSIIKFEMIDNKLIKYKELVENFHRFDRLKHSTLNPKVFTEKFLSRVKRELGEQKIDVVFNTDSSILIENLLDVKEKVYTRDIFNSDS